MLVGNIGIGIFVLILVWILALIIFVFGIKFESNVAWASLGVATCFTIILTNIPVENSNNSNIVDDNLDKDYLFVYQVILLWFLCISAIIGGIFVFLLHCIEPIRAKSVK